MSKKALQKYKDLLRDAGYEMEHFAEPNEEGFNDCLMFFYGTLRKGQSNYWLVQALTELGHMSYIGAGNVPYSVVLDIGGLPALYKVVNVPGYCTVGDCYYCSYIALEIFDYFEGSGRYYQRINSRVNVHTNADGDPIRVRQRMMYVYMGPSIDFGDEGRDFYMHATNKDGIVSDYSEVPKAVPCVPYIPSKAENCKIIMIAPQAQEGGNQ